MTRYWMGVASKEHVLKAVLGNFCQLCHGKQGPLKRMQPGDWLIYYSPTQLYGGREPCRAFTAIGTVTPGEPYTFHSVLDETQAQRSTSTLADKIDTTWAPWRRHVHFFNAQDAPITPLLSQLSFTKNRKRWGFSFMRGFFEITPADFELIASAMAVIHK